MVSIWFNGRLKEDFFLGRPFGQPLPFLRFVIRSSSASSSEVRVSGFYHFSDIIEVFVETDLSLLYSSLLGVRNSGLGKKFRKVILMIFSLCGRSSDWSVCALIDWIGVEGVLNWLLVVWDVIFWDGVSEIVVCLFCFNSLNGSVLFQPGTVKISSGMFPAAVHTFFGILARDWFIVNKSTGAYLEFCTSSRGMSYTLTIKTSSGLRNIWSHVK